MSVENRSRSLWPFAATATVLVLILLVNLPADAPQAAGAALRVQWDPESASFVPVSGPDRNALTADMAAALDRSDAGLSEVRHPDGGVSVDLQGRFRSLAVATIDDRGQVRTGCVTNRDEWDAFGAAAQDVRTTKEVLR